MKSIRWICLAAALLIAALTPLGALADVPTTYMEAFFVNDFVDVIDASDEAYMVDLGERLEDETGAQLVVATVTFLDGMDIEEYAYQMFNNWKLGESEDKQNGVLLLTSVGDRDIWVTVGEDLEKQLPPSVTGAYLDDYAVPYLKDNDFSQGLRLTYEALANKLASIYGATLQTNSNSNTANNNSAYNNSVVNEPYDNNYYNDSYNNTSSGGGFGSFMEIILGIIVLAVIILVVSRLFRSGGGGGNAGCCLLGWLMGRNSGGGR
ncbi:TPM domain-containing protein, partial [Eubacteriales bacterium OttesenSCG-928-A19]|nr:TPM domain-containing protein [Eubacteriales bacterium OttesenSCG-928-A19]